MKAPKLFLLYNIDRGYSLEPVLTSTYDPRFEQISEKYLSFISSKIIIFTAFKNRCILHRHVCVIVCFIFSGGIPALVYPVRTVETKKYENREPPFTT